MSFPLKTPVHLLIAISGEACDIFTWIRWSGSFDRLGWPPKDPILLKRVGTWFRMSSTTHPPFDPKHKKTLGTFVRSHISHGKYLMISNVSDFKLVNSYLRLGNRSRPPISPRFRELQSILKGCELISNLMEFPLKKHTWMALQDWPLTGFVRGMLHLDWHMRMYHSFHHVIYTCGSSFPNKTRVIWVPDTLYIVYVW